MKRDKYLINREKVNQAVALMDKQGLDTWLILTRENSDPSLPLMIGVRSVHKGAIFLNRDGRHVVLTSVSDRGTYEETGIFSEVIPYYAGLDEPFKEVLMCIKPNRLALNISRDDHMADGLTLGQYFWLENVLGKETLKKCEVSSEGILSEVRSIKTPGEVERIQKAVNITTDIYDEVFSQLKTGMTEGEVGGLFVQGMKKRGVTNGLGEALSMPIVCIVRLGLAHRQPGEGEIIPGDIVVFDFSVKYEGYVSDIARTVYFLRAGEERAPKDVQRAFDTTLAAVNAAIAALKPGRKGYEVDAVARKLIEDAGYPTIRHSTGHQIGRACHDGGTILGPRKEPRRPAVEQEIKVGEIYAVEPTVIQDNGLPSFIVEENVLVTPGGPKILSRRQTELITVPAPPGG